MEESDWPTEPLQRQQLLDDFDLGSAFGDRRQEIVFIGVNMNQQAICDMMDSALLTDEELQKYVDKWGTDPDPAHPELGNLKKQRTQ